MRPSRFSSFCCWSSSCFHCLVFSSSGIFPVFTDPPYSTNSELGGSSARLWLQEAVPGAKTGPAPSSSENLAAFTPSSLAPSQSAGPRPPMHSLPPTGDRGQIIPHRAAPTVLPQLCSRPGPPARCRGTDAGLCAHGRRRPSALSPSAAGSPAASRAGLGPVPFQFEPAPRPAPALPASPRPPLLPSPAPSPRHRSRGRKASLSSQVSAAGQRRPRDRGTRRGGDLGGAGGVKARPPYSRRAAGPPPSSPRGALPRPGTAAEQPVPPPSPPPTPPRRGRGVPASRGDAGRELAALVPRAAGGSARRPGTPHSPLGGGRTLPCPRMGCTHPSYSRQILLFKSKNQVDGEFLVRFARRMVLGQRRLVATR